MRQKIVFILIFASFCLFAAGKKSSEERERKKKNDAQTTIDRFCKARRLNQEECLKKIRLRCDNKSRAKLCKALRTIEAASTTTKAPKATTAASTGTAKRVQKAEKAQVQRLNSRLNEKARKTKSLVGIPPDKIPKKNPKARIQHTELTVNKNNDYFFGDLELSRNQATKIEEELNKQAKGGRQKRKVGRSPIFLRWNILPISYSFANDLPTHARETIREAIKLWEQNTCVRWQENGVQSDAIEFYNGPGCSSYVGRVGGLQEISIAVPGCNYTGVVAHELGHSLGFFHEQARPDQLQNLNIVYSNISPFRWNNFVPQEQSEVNDFRYPYDFGSVMHYDGFSFAMNPNLATIATIEPKYQDTIGQRVGPSFIDFAQVNAAYCDGICPPLNCLHGGYPNPNSCSDCKCPAGFSGPLCDIAERSKCSAELTATNAKSYVESPNYPRNFITGQECTWLIKTKPGYKVFLQFVDRFNFDCKTTCDESYVEVKVGPDFRTTGYRFCCDLRPAEVLKSDGNEMLIMFKGLGAVSRGFSAQYWTDAPQPTTKSTTTTTTRAPSTTKATAKTTTTKAAPTTVRTLRPRPTTTKRTTAATTTKATTPPTTQRTTTRPRTTQRTTTRPGTTERTTTTTSTSKPPTTSIIDTRPDDDCEHPCEQWTEWSRCTQDCGACGTKKRTRKCHFPPNEWWFGPKCFDKEEQKCSFDQCQGPGMYLAKNGELHFLIKGCCLGFVDRPNQICMEFWEALRADWNLPALPKIQSDRKITNYTNSITDALCTLTGCGRRRPKLF